jgi:prepilin-type N-terminal cleavage/methylation domain-containing protein
MAQRLSDLVKIEKGDTMKNTVRDRGFTLVELLVVITIIAILIALLLPAVQAAREAARKAQCSNHVKQLALACLGHEQQKGHFPTCGWGYWWFGDPDQGYDRRQPGGWVYNILPFIEQEQLRQVGAGMDLASKKIALVKVAQTPLTGLICPSRRQPILYPATWTGSCNVGAFPNGMAVRTDYAGNSGTYQDFTGHEIGASSDGSTAFVDVPGYKFPDTRVFDGVFFPCSMVTMADITDGTSNTYLVGEKYMNPDDYTTGLDWADNNAVFEGYDWDIVRWATPSDPPRQDTPGISTYNPFGGAHTSSVNISMCDGAVRTISYNIDLTTHTYLGQRADEHPVDGGSF